MNAMPSLDVLVVDDESALPEQLRRLFVREGHPQVRQPRGEAVEDRRVDQLAGALDRVASVVAEVVARPLGARDTDAEGDERVGRGGAHVLRRCSA
jgi:CheY-like chemotaxis protein